MEQKEHKADAIVKKYATWAVGIGLIPMPLVDFAALFGIQLKMLHRLTKEYDIEFSRELGKSFIGALIGGSVSASLAGSLSKILPVFGALTGMVSTSVFGSASTYAIGKVFIFHFETGETLLTFDPEQMKDYYRKQYEHGVEYAKDRSSYIGIKP